MVTIKSNISLFSKLLKTKTEQSLKEMGRVGKENIDDLTPEISGKLKSGNEWMIDNDYLYFKNEVEYAKYVEYGTYKMAANPFTRNGISNSKEEFIQILLRDLGV